MIDLFKDKEFIKKLIARLPKYIDDLNKSFMKDGKLSPDIGTLREKMMCGILKKQFQNDFNDDIPPQTPEADFVIFEEPISLKTTASKTFKLIWTANYEKAMEFYKNFNPECSIMVMLFQKRMGGLYYFPIESLQETREEMGLNFLKKPKAKTNPRGVVLSAKAFNNLARHDLTQRVSIDWDDIYEGEYTAVNLIDHYYKIW